MGSSKKEISPFKYISSKSYKIRLNPKKLGSIANHKQQPWKEPLADFIDRIYEKSLGQGTFKSDLID